MTRMDAPHDRATWQKMEGWPWHRWLNSENIVSTEYLVVRCAVESGTGAQWESGLSRMTERPISHTRSATWMAPAKPRAFRYPQESTKAKVKVNAKVKTMP